MYLGRVFLNRSRQATMWAANPYRMHQRLLMACEGDSRLLFRLEEGDDGACILVQSQVEPDWQRAFGEFAVLAGPPEHKVFEPRLEAGRGYRFRLLANPAVKKQPDREHKPNGQRLGLVREADQRDWLARKLAEAGATPVGCIVMPRGLQHSYKAGAGKQTHLAVLFEGLLRAEDPVRLRQALESGIGPAKGFGFGLLSLARIGV